MDLTWESGDGISAMVFDATMRETHNAKSRPTPYPLDDGAVAVDHVVLEPWVGIFECVVTDTPLGTPATHSGGATGSVQSQSLELGVPSVITRAGTFARGTEYSREEQTATAQTLQFDQPVNRCELVWAELERLRTNRVLVTASTRLGDKENLIIASLSAPWGPEDGTSITFTLELHQIDIAQSQVVDVPEPAEPRARRRTDVGATSTAPATAQQESLAHQWFL